MGWDQEKIEREDEGNDYFVVSLVYCCLDRPSSLCLAQIGDFHLNETELPVGRLRGKEKTKSDLLKTAGDSPQVSTSEGRVLFVERLILFGKILLSSGKPG